MSFWSKVLLMVRPKNPRIRALENKVAKLQEQLKKYEAHTVVEAVDENEEESTTETESVDSNMTEFQFVVDLKGNYKAFKLKPDYKIYNLGDSSIRAEFELKKLLAHGDLLPKRIK